MEANKQSGKRNSILQMHTLRLSQANGVTQLVSRPGALSITPGNVGCGRFLLHKVSAFSILSRGKMSSTNLQSVPDPHCEPSKERLCLSEMKKQTPRLGEEKEK